MNKKLHFLSLTALTLLVMVVSALHPMIARADDSTPAAPSSPAAVDTSAPADTSVAPADTSVAPADTTVPSADASATSAPATAVAPTDTSAAATTVASTDTAVAPTDTTVAPTDTTIAPTDSSSLVDAVPTGTPVVVLDATGTVVPLATQAAADIIKTGDPIWCPTGASPVASSGGCTGSYGDLYSLVNAINTSVISQPSSNGTIWIEQGSDGSTSDISINGSSLTTWANYALTLQGGWDGSSAGTLSGTSTFSKYISITNWNNDVTINDINITNPTGDGLTVTEASGSTGNITVHHVNSSHNINNNGAQLDNSLGSGSISVDNSTFNGNAGYGLIATSNGDITLNNVTASNNINAAGAQLDNSSGSGSISLTGTNNFNDNGADGLNGLDVYSNGDITLTNVTADGNSGDGAFLNNALLDPIITNSYFNGNSANGLEVYSSGDVTLTNVTADYNNYDGALLGNSSFDGDVQYYDEIGGNITVTGGDFSNNQGNGYCDYGHFLGCSDDPAGLEAYADGTISLSGVTANCNGTDCSGDTPVFYNSADGVYLDNCLYNSGDGDCANSSGSGITVDNSTLGGEFNNNSANGLEIHSNGDVALTDVTADGNAYAGALLGGFFEFEDAPIGGTVMVTGGNFNDNSYGEEYSFFIPPAGLVVFASGDQSLSGVTVDYNDYYGAILVGFGDNITVDSSQFSYNGQSGDTGDGLDAINFEGDINLTNVAANDNYGDGADLSNGLDPIITNSQFDGNGGDGLDIFSNGDITLTGVTASGNTDDGIYLNQGVDPTDTITCSVANDNSGYGVEADLVSGTTLTLNSVTLSDNGNGNIPHITGGTLVTNSVNCNPSHGKSGGGLPLNIINVTGGDGNPLDCTDYSGTELVLPDQDHAILPCPISQTGIITGKTSSNLPGTLDSKFTFVSAFDVEVNPSLTGMMTISFKIPAGKESAHFTILHWDGTKWVNLGGSINPPGFFSVDTNLTGEFVLVTQ